MITTLRKSISTSLPASLKARMSVVVFLLVLGAVALLALATLAVAERDMRGVTGEQQYASLASAAVFIDEELAAKRHVLRVMADSLAAQEVGDRPVCSVFCPPRRCWARNFSRLA